jgi:hypothetical protein
MDSRSQSEVLCDARKEDKYDCRFYECRSKIPTSERIAATRVKEMEEDKVAAAKAEEILDDHEVRDDPKLLYQLWVLCQTEILETLQDCTQSRAAYSFRFGPWLTPLQMLSVLLEEVEQYTCDGWGA